MVIIASSRKDYERCRRITRPQPRTARRRRCRASKHAAHGGNDIFYRETEMLEQDGGGRRFAESVDADSRAARVVHRADVLAPEVADARFDRDSGNAARKYASAIRRVLAVEQARAG